MRLYEIWWADLPDPVGRRPVLLLSRNRAYEQGLERRSVANLDNVGVVGRTRLRARIGMLAPQRYSEIKRALGHALAWPELTESEPS